MTGAELRAHRLAAGMTQVELALRAGIGRHAVIYWEAKPVLPRRGWAVGRMAEVLGVSVYHTTNARTGGWAVSPFAAMDACIEARLAAELARLVEREAARNARRRVPCGAKTRKGTSCRNLSEPGKRRCKFHGGKSTGARTPEGIERIRQAQRRRWARWRDEMGGLPAHGDETRRCQSAEGGALLGQDNRG